MFDRLMGRATPSPAVERLYPAIVERARAEHWYLAGGVPDTIDGRFDMIAALLSLVMLRLERDPAQAAAGVALAEAFVDDMDPQLRQIGFGDMVVGKHVGRMMGMLGGRLGAYRDGLAVGDLGPALVRNLYRGTAPEPRQLEHVAQRHDAVVGRVARHAPCDTGRRGTAAVIAPEFSRPRRLDTIGAGEVSVSVEADAAERDGLAARFDLLKIERLTADYRLHGDADTVVAHGHLSATVVQACVATGEPVTATIEEDFALRFIAESKVDAEEIELDADALDTMFHEGGAIDLGEAAAETMALALDPFPRSPGAAAALAKAGVKREEEVAAERPAGAFSGLRDLLK